MRATWESATVQSEEQSEAVIAARFDVSPTAMGWRLHSWGASSRRGLRRKEPNASAQTWCPSQDGDDSAEWIADSRRKWAPTLTIVDSEEWRRHGLEAPALALADGGEQRLRSIRRVLVLPRRVSALDPWPVATRTWLTTGDTRDRSRWPSFCFEPAIGIGRRGFRLRQRCAPRSKRREHRRDLGKRKMSCRSVKESRSNGRSGRST